MSSLEWLGRGTYIEKCCVTDTNIALTCSTASKDGDWSNTVLMMLGHQFCDDLVGRKGVVKINVSGIYIQSSTIYRRSHIINIRR